MLHITPKKNDILYVEDRVKCALIYAYQEKQLISNNEWWYYNANHFLEEKDIVVVLEVLINNHDKMKRLKCLFKKKVIYIKESEFYNLTLLS